MHKKTLIIALCCVLILLSGCDVYDERFNNACGRCGYDNFTDVTFDNDYNYFLNPIKLALVECDGKHIIQLYDGIHSTDKWGNDFISREAVVFCDKEYYNRLEEWS